MFFNLDIMQYLNIDIIQYLNINIMQYLNIYIMQYLNIDIMQYLNLDIMQYLNIDIMEFCQIRSCLTTMICPFLGSVGHTALFAAGTVLLPARSQAACTVRFAKATLNVGTTCTMSL